jgi:hypothetical protein
MSDTSDRSDRSDTSDVSETPDPQRYMTMGMNDIESALEAH